MIDELTKILTFEMLSTYMYITTIIRSDTKRGTSEWTQDKIIPYSANSFGQAGHHH